VPATAGGRLRPGARNDLTDVAGIRVGHHQRLGRGWRTGTTVVLPPAGAVTAVDVRGGGPATRETDALDPRNMVPTAHAICLTGGSAYGLAAADGVMQWLEERGIGFPVGAQPGQVVPIVPAAALFDLGRGGDFTHRPDATFGRRAAANAAGPRRPAAVALGTVGAGTGAVTGGIAGGVGSASVVLADGATVAALVVVNAVGATFDPRTGILYGAGLLLAGDARLRRPTARSARAAADRLAAAAAATRRPFNTTLGVVATDVLLTKAQAHKLAGVTHGGLARAVRPSHLMSDGDTFFALATGTRPLLEETDAADGATPSSAVAAFNELLAAAADVVTRAIVRAVVAADATPERPSYRELFPESVGSDGPR
jgi:putative pantetheine hydrolase